MRKQRYVQSALVLLMSALPLMVVRAENALQLQPCFRDAGRYYNIAPELLQAIAQQESRLDSRAVNRNSDGSLDVGLMQINSAWLPTLRRYGIQERSLYDACTSIWIGAWVLANNVARYGYSWDAVGAYNAAGRSKRIRYAHRIARELTRGDQQLLAPENPAGSDSRTAEPAGGTPPSRRTDAAGFRGVASRH